LASKDTTDALPFGTIKQDSAPKRTQAGSDAGGDGGNRSSEPPQDHNGAAGGGSGTDTEQKQERPDWRKSSNRRGSGRRKKRRGGRPGGEAREGESGGETSTSTKQAQAQQPQLSRRQRAALRSGDKQHPRPQKEKERVPVQVASGMLVIEKGGYGVLRREEAQLLPSKGDIYVPIRLIQKLKLSEGSMIEGRVAAGQKHKFQLLDVQRIDGEDPDNQKKTTPFKSLTSIDPDFHYATGDVHGDVSMRIVDLLCPIGRGQRGLIVAPPRTGKTTLMRQFARAIETAYPDVHLMILLIDERPEEATEWRRSIEHGKVFVSTADETTKTHIQLAEAVWKRCTRLVELGEDVILLLDSITRLARAYNNMSAGGGRTMSGGLDSRAMERPRKIFGSARNTETAGSLTILGTTLIETGSRLDQLVFEEFKGTGNMELVLSRKLADRRIFPAIDVEKTGTRKEEKLLGMRRLKLVHTLRRVLTRMNFVEAMELLITKLEEVDKTDDFLKRFEVDPEA